MNFAARLQEEKSSSQVPSLAELHTKKIKTHISDHYLGSYICALKMLNEEPPRNEPKRNIEIRENIIRQEIARHIGLTLNYTFLAHVCDKLGLNDPNFVQRRVEESHREHTCFRHLHIGANYYATQQDEKRDTSPYSIGLYHYTKLFVWELAKNLENEKTTLPKGETPQSLADKILEESHALGKTLVATCEELNKKGTKLSSSSLRPNSANEFGYGFHTPQLQDLMSAVDGVIQAHMPEALPNMPPLKNLQSAISAGRAKS